MAWGRSPTQHKSPNPAGGPGTVRLLYWAGGAGAYFLPRMASLAALSRRNFTTFFLGIVTS